MIAPSRRPEAGFTLLEFLVVIALLSLIMAGLAGIMHFGGQAWNRQEKRLASESRIEHVQALLRNALSRTYPAVALQAGNDRALEFEGKSTGIAFVGPLPGPFGADGFYRLNLEQTGPPANRQIVLSWRPYNATAADNPSPAMPERVTLLDGIQSIHFRYFGADAPGVDPTWRDTWVKAPNLPTFIGITVTFSPADDRFWPEFAVAPMITLDAGCIYDRTTQHCR